MQSPAAPSSHGFRIQTLFATASHVVNHPLRRASRCCIGAKVKLCSVSVRCSAYTSSPGFLSWLALPRQKRAAKGLCKLIPQGRCCAVHHIAWTSSEHVRQKYLDGGSDGTTPVTAYGCDWYATGVDAVEPALTSVAASTNSILSHADLRTPLVSPSQSNSSALPAFESEAPGTPSSRHVESKGCHQDWLSVSM